MNDGNELIYLDNAATTQLPETVIDAWTNHYRYDNGNAHRGVHRLSMRSTEKMESARRAVAGFLGAGSPENIVFTSGTTAAIHLVAEGFLRSRLTPGDAVVVSELEHHSNYLPWLELCRQTGAELKALPVEAFERLDEHLNERTKLVAVAHVTNTNGYLFPLKRIVAAAHGAGVPVLVDGAQAVRALQIDLKDLDADFYCVSGHKMFAPAGIGALYVSDSRIGQMRPVSFGGGMISAMNGSEPVFEEFPYCMEAGTGNYGGIVAWKAALDFIDRVGRQALHEREREISRYLYDRLRVMDDIRILGDNAHHLGCVSIAVDGQHPMDVAMLLDRRGVAVRSGSHCAIPAHRSYGAEGSLRISTAFYNTEQEIDRCVACLQEAIRVLRW